MTPLVFEQTAYVAEVEQMVLGAMMFGGDFEAISALQDHHFVEAFHQHLFRAIKTAAERYGSTNPVTVAKLISDDAKSAFEASSGTRVHAYLARLLSVPTTDVGRSGEHAKRIIEQWARLSIANEAGRIYAAANDPMSDVRAIAADAARSLDDIMAEVRNGGPKKTRSSIGTAAGVAIDAAIVASKTGTGLTGITWGLSDINRLTGGIQKKDLTLIGARPSMGKTTFALSSAMKAAAGGASIGIISLEMDREKLACRAISDALYDWSVKIPYANIIRGNLSDKEFDLIVDQQTRMETLPIIIDDQSGQTMSDIRIRTERLVEETEAAGRRLSAIMIDHLGLIRASSRYSGNRVNEIAEITSGLKGLARDCDIAVVLLSQLNRAVESREDKRPTLSDLRDSGAIEQDADTIAFLYRDAYYLERAKGGSPEEEFERADKLEASRNSLEFIIAKQRNGPLDTVHLFADMAFSAIRNGVRQ